MKLEKNHILVKVDLNQTEKAEISGLEFFTAKTYSDNWREKSPVVCKVIQGAGYVKKGHFLVCHYTHFYGESPYLLYDGYYSIPCDEMIIARILSDGELIPMFGNILCGRIKKEYVFEVPVDYVKTELSRVIVAFDCSEYKKGTEIFILRYSDYEIVYMWNGKEHRYIKISSDEVVGYVKN